MRKENYFYLGRILKKHSFKGELIVDFLSALPFDSYENLKNIFVEIGNGMIPFSIEKIKRHKEGFRIALEKIKNEQDADLLLGKNIYLPLSFLPERKGKNFYYHEIINFTITDTNEGLIGRITSVNERGVQHLFEIKNEHKKKPILIPVTSAFILEVDRAKKNIIVNLPKGLLDLY